MTQRSHGFRLAIFLDGAKLQEMISIHEQGIVDGFTTNPTLMAKAGVRDYRGFAREAVAAIQDVPISFEVFSDDFIEMAAQAREISSWGSNVFVKIPISNTRGERALEVVRELTAEGVRVNVTAAMTLGQVEAAAEAIAPGTQAMVSIFAGRIADTGRDPVPLMRDAVGLCAGLPLVSVLWASPREVLNVYQAEECGVHAITLTGELLAKLRYRGKDLEEFSRETVQMFYDDARRSGYQLGAEAVAAT